MRTQNMQIVEEKFLSDQNWDLYLLDDKIGQSGEHILEMGWVTGRQWDLGLV